MKKESNGFAIGEQNMKLIIIGLVIIVIGFALMAGGGSSDPTVYDEEIFNFRRVTLAPLIVLFGFMFEIYAIMKRPKQK